MNVLTLTLPWQTQQDIIMARVSPGSWHQRSTLSSFLFVYCYGVVFLTMYVEFWAWVPVVVERSCLQLVPPKEHFYFRYSSRYLSIVIYVCICTRPLMRISTVCALCRALFLCLFVDEKPPIQAWLLNWLFAEASVCGHIIASILLINLEMTIIIRLIYETMHFSVQIRSIRSDRPSESLLLARYAYASLFLFAYLDDGRKRWIVLNQLIFLCEKADIRADQSRSCWG